MFGRIIFAAALAGLAAGLALTAIQAYAVIPLILEAETYEDQGPVTDDHGHESEDSAAWAPADGGERLIFTLATNVIAGIAFALLLTAAMALIGTGDWRRGMIWGLAGYATFSLAPAFGLPPELPGMAAGELGARQIWWAATAASTAAGLALLLLVPRVALRALGAVLIVVPHVIGAPHPDGATASAVPAELAASFVSATLVANLLFWLVIGGASAWAFSRPSFRRVD
ncbi:MAG: CbtA family protein [Alphaproteobacteria bacterium]